MRSRVLLCAGGCSSCGVLLRHLEAHSMTHVGEASAAKAVTAAGAENMSKARPAGEGKVDS